MKRILSIAFGAAVLIAILHGQNGDVMWAPKRASRYTPPHKPWTKLAEVKAKHSGQSNWRELVVDDDDLRAEWIQSAPNGAEPRQLHPDTREWWVVQEGQIEFSIEGQQPFVAGARDIVQVPQQTFFSLKAVGEKPALRFEVNVARAKTLYASEVHPPSLPGFDWIQVKVPRKPGVYEHNNKPRVTFAEEAALAEKKQGTFQLVQDDRGAANFIYGYEKNLPPLDPKQKGHFHPDSSEFWLIMAGQIRYPIEGQGVVIANEGDVVYVPPFTWHAPRWYGPGPSCRLAMNGYPAIAHLFPTQPD